jgi:hypothetical protein
MGLPVSILKSSVHHIYVDINIDLSLFARWVLFRISLFFVLM